MFKKLLMTTSVCIYLLSICAQANVNVTGHISKLTLTDDGKVEAVIGDADSNSTMRYAIDSTLNTTIKKNFTAILFLAYSNQSLVTIYGYNSPSPTTVQYIGQIECK
jgi:hypothetical protein